MDTLRIGRNNIFPQSISDISMVNEDSEFAESLNQKSEKNYQIKINGQQSMPNINTSEFPFQKFERLQYLQQQNLLSFQSPAHLLDEETVPHPQKLEYKEKITGYDTMKDKLNDEELLKAFKIIDITKDDIITQEDIVFILDYLKEDYTMEEVKEMIEMVSTDKTHVYFQNFKDVAKGEIMPLAAFKIPNHQTKSKTEIFSNLHASDLLSQDPSKILEQMKNGTISFEKYEQIKKNKKKVGNQRSDRQQGKFKIQGDILKTLDVVLPLKTESEFRERKEKFNEYLVIASKELFQKIAIIPTQAKLNHSEIANLFQINIKQARELYSLKSKKADEKELIFRKTFILMEMIAYSKLKQKDKLEMSFAAINPYQTITIAEIEHILQFMKGKDPNISKKIKAIFLNKGFQLTQNFSLKKIDALEILSDYLNILII